MAQHESSVPHPAQHLFRRDSLAPPVAQEPPLGAHVHPQARVYIEVAIILTVITIVELFTLYLPNIGVEAARPLLVPVFILLSATKFLLVIGWYMHLRFDPPVFRRIFGFALIVALTIATAFIALFHGIYP